MGPSNTLIQQIIDLSKIDDRYIKPKGQANNGRNFLIGSPAWNPYNHKMIHSNREDFEWIVAGLIRDLVRERDWSMGMYQDPNDGRMAWHIVIRDWKNKANILLYKKFYGPTETSCMVQAYIEVAEKYPLKSLLQK